MLLCIAHIQTEPAGSLPHAHLVAGRRNLEPLNRQPELGRDLLHTLLRGCGVNGRALALLCQAHLRVLEQLEVLRYCVNGTTLGVFLAVEQLGKCGLVQCGGGEVVPGRGVQA